MFNYKYNYFRFRLLCLWFSTAPLQVTIIDGDGARVTALPFGDWPSTLVSESISEDDMLENESSPFCSLVRDLPLGWYLSNWRGISYMYVSFTSSQIGCNGIAIRYGLSFLSIQVNKFCASGVCEISKQLIPKK